MNHLIVDIKKNIHFMKKMTLISGYTEKKNSLTSILLIFTILQIY